MNKWLVKYYIHIYEHGEIVVRIELDTSSVLHWTYFLVLNICFFVKMLNEIKNFISWNSAHNILQLIPFSLSAAYQESLVCTVFFIATPSYQTGYFNQQSRSSNQWNLYYKKCNIKIVVHYFTPCLKYNDIEHLYSIFYDSIMSSSEK